jgi:hypothetical protein
MEQASMTKVLRMLVGGGLAAVLGVVLLGLGGVFSADRVSAESPPNPPSRFAGSVLVDGAAPPPGTTITAKIGSTTCGVTATFMSGSEARYVIDVPALDPGATPNCGAEGSVVTFLIGDRPAAQTGSWANYQLSILNLTAATAPSPTGSPPATPKPPSSGTGTDSDGGSPATWLYIVLGAGALAFTAGGFAAARRGR